MHFIASLITILFGIGAFVKNRELVKTTLTEWTRRGRKVIYIWALPNENTEVILHLYLCGEETSLFYPSTYENYESYILAMRQIYYRTSHRSNSDRDEPIADWRAMDIQLLSEDEYPCAFQLIGECGFRFRLSNDNGENITVSDAFKFKTELKECLKKCEIKYVKKAPDPQDRWKARDK